jgi:hypothetical protein
MYRYLLDFDFDTIPAEVNKGITPVWKKWRSLILNMTSFLLFVDLVYKFQ